MWLLAIADAPAMVNADAVQTLDQQLHDLQNAITARQTADKPAPKILRWAISKMGFTPDGTAALSARGIATSDYLQLELLAQLLNTPAKAAEVVQPEVAAPSIPEESVVTEVPIVSEASTVAELPGEVEETVVADTGND